MKFTLVDMPVPHAPEGKYKSQIPTPFSLLQVGSALLKEGHEVQLLNHLHNTKPPLPPASDMYVLNMSECTVMDNCLDHAIEYLRLIKFSSNAPIWLMGFYSWLHKTELIGASFRVADPLYYENDISGNHREEEFYPEWSLWDFSWSPNLGKDKRVTIRASRGCPHHCLMCPVNLVYHQKTRRFSCEWVLNNISTLYNKYQVKEIGFLDDNLFVDRKWGKALLCAIINQSYRGLHFTFEEGLDVPTALDDELCVLLKRAGFYHIKLGVESFNNRVLDFIKKPYRDPDIAIEAIKRLQSHGLNPTCFLCFGFPDDTEASIKETIDLCEKLGIRLRVQILYHYPSIDFASCPVPMSRLKELKAEAVTRTKSESWHHK